MTIPRRRFLIGSAATALSACTAGGSDNDGTEGTQGPEERAALPDADWGGHTAPAGDTFPNGVASGEPDPGGLIVWTRYTGEGAVELRWARWDGEAWIAQEPVAMSPVEGFVHHALGGLAPDEAVAYQFVAGAEASAVGHGRTAIAADSDATVYFGATSCLSLEHVDFPSLTHLAAERADALLWLGDMVYADGSESRDDYRAFYDRAQKTKGFQAVNHRFPGIYTWDDHEFDNNFVPVGFPAEQLAAAREAFLEHLPMAKDPTDPARIWRSRRFGMTAEVFTLDCRTERDKAAGRYLSEAQMEWFLAALRDSPCVWKLVMTSVPITDMPDAWETVAGSDSWFSYPEDRQVVLDAAVEVGGVLFVGGDFHHTTLSRVTADGPSQGIFEVFAGPGGSFLNVLARLIEDEEQFLYSDAQWSAAHLEVRSDGTARVRFIGEDPAKPVFFDATLRTDGTLTIDQADHPSD